MRLFSNEEHEAILSPASAIVFFFFFHVTSVPLWPMLLSFPFIWTCCYCLRHLALSLRYLSDAFRTIEPVLFKTAVLWDPLAPISSSLNISPTLRLCSLLLSRGASHSHPSSSFEHQLFKHTPPQHHLSNHVELRFRCSRPCPAPGHGRPR